MTTYVSDSTSSLSEKINSLQMEPETSNPSTSSVGIMETEVEPVPTPKREKTPLTITIGTTETTGDKRDVAMKKRDDIYVNKDDWPETSKTPYLRLKRITRKMGNFQAQEEFLMTCITDDYVQEYGDGGL